MNKNEALLVLDDSLREVIHTDFTIELLDDTSEFTEGPVWSKNGYYLFSDIPRNIISKIEVGKPKEVFLESSGCSNLTEDVYPRMQGSNGLGYDAEESLLICQHGNHGIGRYKDGRLKTFIHSYNGKPFNSPNDIIIAKNGTVFFSDPPYGLTGQKLMEGKFQPVAAVYSWKEDALQLICDHYQYPNGVCLSPDESKLYICSNKPFERFVTEYDTADFTKSRILCAENGDGIECDKQGNLYLCAKEGIVIVNSEGNRLGVIQMETVAANACWGGNERRDLFITAQHNTFLIRNLQKA